MKKISASVYKETYYALKNYPDLLKNIPNKILKHIEKEALKSNQSIQFEENQEILFQISKDSLALCIYFYIKYGNLTEMQIEKMKELLISNEIKLYDFFEKNKKISDILNDTEKELNDALTFEENEIIKQVRLEVEKEIREYMTEDKIGYEDQVHKEMKKRLDEKGISWSQYDSGIIQ